MDRSRWRYVLVGIGTLNVVWSLGGVFSGERITAGPATLWVLLGGSFLLFTPVFYYALYRETRAIREADSHWRPTPRIWVGGGAAFSLLGLAMFLNPMTHYVAGLYLAQRVRKTTASAPGSFTDR